MTPHSTTHSWETTKFPSAQDLLKKLGETDDIGFNDVVQAVDLITDMQAAIDKVVERAAYDLNRRRRRLNNFIAAYTPHIQRLKDRLGSVGKTLRLGSAGIVRWEKSGGFIVEDREKLAAALDEMTDEQLAAFGAKRVVSFDSDKIVRAVQETGEALPGVTYVEPDAYATFRIGVNKPWSPRLLKQRIGKALDGEIEETDENAE